MYYIYIYICVCMFVCVSCSACTPEEDIGCQNLLFLILCATLKMLIIKLRASGRASRTQSLSHFTSPRVMCILKELSIYFCRRIEYS